MNAQDICRKVANIAHAAWDDRILDEGPLAEQIEAVANSRPHGSDGDLTDGERSRLLKLAQSAREAGL